MRDSIWLILTAGGIVQTRKGEPPASALKTHQRAVRLTVSVPDSAFHRPPAPTAHLDIPEAALRLPAIPPLDVAVDFPNPEPVRGASDVSDPTQDDSGEARPAASEQN